MGDSLSIPSGLLWSRAIIHHGQMPSLTWSQDARSFSTEKSLKPLTTKSLGVTHPQLNVQSGIEEEKEAGKTSLLILVAHTKYGHLFT